jgi:AAA15 family ATPase/GTPase
MFTSIRLKNFKSFGDIYFDFRKSKNDAKKFIAVYGENGSGKSNFADGFELLSKSISSLSIIKQDLYQTFKEKSSLLIRNEYFHSWKRILNTFEVESFMNECRMIGTDEDTEAEYAFILNGVEGRYKIVFNDEIINEELFFLVGKKRGTIYSISKDDKGIKKVINDSVFTDRKFRDDFNEELDKYWGKHTFLGILANIIYTQNLTYVTSKVSSHIIDVVYYFDNLHVVNSNGDSSHVRYLTKDEQYLLSDLSGGILPSKSRNQLDFCEELLCEYFTQLYSDVRKVYYEKTETDKGIKYKLYVKKQIAGELRDIPFEFESTGTKKVMKIMEALFAAMNGNIVVYDEIDSGVHDILMENLISSALEYVQCQLIITTHNTMLLESMDPKSIYVIYVDYKGNKRASCIDDYDIRIQKNNNVRDMYLKGLFGGIPYSGNIDCSNIYEIVNEIKDKDRLDEKAPEN